MKLTREQRDKVKEWVAAGFNAGEINQMAESIEPSFTVSRQQVDQYKKALSPTIQKVLEERKVSPVINGLAIKENRISLLQQLADAMRKDLVENDKTWVVGKVQLVGRGDDAQMVEVEEFNHQEVNQLRGVLDDIAKEVGGRKVVSELRTDGPIEIVVKRINATTDSGTERTA